MSVWRSINWKWKGLAAVAAILACSWFGLALYARRGLHDFIHEFQTNPDCESPVFWWVGPSTRAELSELAKSEYSISILPFDWVGSGQMVTHTAFLATDSKTLKLRLRYNPLDRHFHIVGYTTEPN